MQLLADYARAGRGIRATHAAERQRGQVDRAV